MGNDEVSKLRQPSKQTSDCRVKLIKLAATNNPKFMTKLGKKSFHITFKPGIYGFVDDDEENDRYGLRS